MTIVMPYSEYNDTLDTLAVIKTDKYAREALWGTWTLNGNSSGFIIFFLCGVCYFSTYILVSPHYLMVIIRSSYISLVKLSFVIYYLYLIPKFDVILILKCLAITYFFSDLFKSFNSLKL